MELELGLTLGTHHPMQGFDLNKDWFEPKVMEGSDGSSHGYPLGGRGCGYKRQKIDKEGFDSRRSRKVLSLVSWNEEPNKKDDDDLGENISCQLVSCTKNLEDQSNHTKGWPPIQSWRKKFLPSYHIQHDQQTMDRYHFLGNNIRSNRLNSMYIKVKMEGVAIGRKINLRCYDSYEELLSTLITMFAKYTNDDDHNNMSNYTLKFQDRDGEWLQARDSSWQTLVESVRRVEIKRNNIAE